MRKRLIVLITFLGGIYFFLEFVLPEKLPTPPFRGLSGLITHLGGAQEADGWFSFKDLKSVAAAAARLGVRVDVPESAAERPARLKRTTHSVIVEVTSDASDKPEEWVNWTSKDGKWRTKSDAPPMTFERLAAAFGGKETGDGGFAFEDPALGAKAALDLGATVEFPTALAGQPVTLRRFTEGKRFIRKLGVSVEILAPGQSASTPLAREEMDGWRFEKSRWIRNCRAPRGFEEIVQVASALEVGPDESGRFNFKEAEQAIRAVKEFGLDVKLPDALRKRAAWLKREKRALVFAVQREPSDDQSELAGWTQRGDFWTRTFSEHRLIMGLAAEATKAGATRDETGQFHFAKTETAVKVLSAFGVAVDLPTALAERPVRLQREKGDLTLGVEAQPGDDAAVLQGWTLEPARWVKTYKTYSYFVFGGYHEEISDVLIVIGVMAIGLGLINILRSHGVNLLLRRRGWINSAALVGAMFVTMAFGFWNWSNALSRDEGFSVSEVSTQVGNFYTNAIVGLSGLLTGLSSAMFSLLAVYIAAAAYRAFRVKSGEAALMMITALLVMMGQIPIGVTLLDPGFRLLFKGGIAEGRSWLLQTVNAAVFRAIAFGAGVAGLAMAVRMWFSMEAGAFYRDREK